MTGKATLLVLAGFAAGLLAWQGAAQSDPDVDAQAPENQPSAVAVVPEEAPEPENVESGEQNEPGAAVRQSSGLDRGGRSANPAQTRPSPRDSAPQSRSNPGRQRDRNPSGPGPGRRGDPRRSPRSDRGPNNNQTTNGPGLLNLAAFKIITDRNIFDSTRSPRSSQPRGEGRRPQRVDTFTLVGTLSYEKGPYAFFDGSSSEYRKVLQTGKSIAGHKITAITGNTVKLELGTNAVELTVGMQMRREDSGWQVQGGGAISRSLSAADSATASSASASADETDIVKRLMQQREQELK